MNYLLIVCLIIILFLSMKIIAMRLSLKELKEGYEERARIHTNTLLTVSSRDRRVRELAVSMNKTLEKLRDSYNRYENGDQEIKKAITNISHDLRTPLTAISGYLELAQRQEKSPGMEKYLSVIENRTEHMKKLTEELFEYSLMSGGEITEDKQEVNVNRMLEDCIMNYYPSLKAMGINPEIDITDKKIIRNLYPTYVERILSNLVSNALKYSDGDLEIMLSDEGILRVTNSSDKLSNVDVNKLFDRFFTVETGSRNSTGLGLSIVKLFTERMDLRLNATYENGKIAIEVGF
ncbi:sensor histidine kinase [Butyrivibrio sp. AC2005]|uniref:sensor histidine kinase n=1 Tax=Butyrivibrio sp. AC2005 TaxID=1280672 RepID=UPI00047A120B|nr:HAMP domain-containing sensor histidine kinase [Butyrivibrio sp. AC2005]